MDVLQEKKEAGSSALGLTGWNVAVSNTYTQDGAGSRVRELGLEFYWDWGCVG